MLRIVLVSDMHIFQTPTVEYDPVPDFKKACEIMVGLGPDILIFAGDMFDYKHSVSSFVRWFEGEGRMISVRPLLEKLKARVLAIRGNHEKEEILKSVNQTVKNFEYVGDGCVEIKGLRVWFLDTRYERGSAEGKKALEEVCSEAKNVGGKKILVIHENVGQMEDPIPDETIELASKMFDLVFNGHAHSWGKYNGFENVYLLPSLLPSRLKRGSYWVERYCWESREEKFHIQRKDSPYGLVLLDTEKEEIRFIPVEPSKRIVEVSVGVDGLSLQEVKRRFDEILDKIERAVVLPEIHGAIGFPPEAIEQHLGEKGKWVGELEKNVGFAPMARGEIKVPQLPDVGEIIKRLVPKVVKEKGPEMDEGTVYSVFFNMLNEGRLAEPRSSPKDRLMDLLLPMFEKIKGKKPEFFEKDIQEILSPVRKVRK